jgi:dihydrofolate reductase
VGQFVASLLMTVDGFDGNDVFAPTADEHQVFNDLLARTEGMVCDRENYELLVPYWDDVDTDDPAAHPVERQFAEIFRTKPRFVVSDTLDQVDALATLIRIEPVGRLREIKEATTGDLMVAAGPGLLASLLDYGLIDEVEALMLPVVVGSGNRQIGDLARKQPLTLIQSRALSTGAVFLRYRVNAERSPAHAPTL